MLKRLLWMAPLGLLLAGCGPSPQMKAFTEFRDAVRDGDCTNLERLSAFQARGWVDEFCGSGAAKLAAEMSASPAVAMMHFKRTVESKEEGADGMLRLRILEKVKARPSNFSKPAPPRRYNVGMKKDNGAWVLYEYTSEDAAE